MSAHLVIVLAGTVAVAVLSFWVTWKKWGDGGEVAKMDSGLAQFMGVEFKRGIDGKRHMKSMPRHVRLALSLISGLAAAILMTLYFRWVD